MTIELKNITQKFSKKLALDNVSLSFSSAKIYAIVGENGSGKSTLASIVCGDRIPTSGSLFIDGNPIVFKNPKDATEQGIRIVHQRPLLAKTITVKENILLGAKKLIEEYKTMFAPNLNMNTLVQNLGGDERFYTALLGALCHNPKVLILDEPTVFLNDEQRNSLFKNLQTLAKNGTCIIIITHNMSEAQNYSDTVTSLCKGKILAHYENSKDFKKGKLGFFESNFYKDYKQLNDKNNEKTSNQNSNVSNLSKISNFAKKESSTMKFSNITVRPINRPALFDISFSIKSNQITLIKGLAESGLGTLEDLVSGMISFYCKGNVSLSCYSNYFKNCNFKINHARHHLTTAMLRGRKTANKQSYVQKKITAIIPSDRAFRASNPELTVEQLLCVYYTGKNHTEYAQKLIKKAEINIQPYEKAKKLSGGMLQRLILARELDTEAKFLILCEPLQGLDLKASAQMCLRLAKLAEDGKAILVLSSSDFPKEICQTIYNLTSGKLFLPDYLKITDCKTS